MSTETFLEHFEADTLGDQPEWFDWYAAAQGKQIWSRKHTILAHLHMTATLEYYGTRLLAAGGWPPSQTMCILDLKRRRGRVLQRTCGTS